jgi:hypothetical protein
LDFVHHFDSNVVLHFRIHKKIQEDATVYQNFIISYLYEAQHVSGDVHHQEPKTALAASGFLYMEG